MTTNTLATIIILGLASWRLARIVPTDTIAQPLRDRLTLWTYPEEEPGRPQLREWFGQLVSCQICLGFWVAGLVTLFYSLVVAGAWLGWAFVIWWPAVAAVSAVASLYDQGDV